VAAENVWFSKTLKSTGAWDYFINFFDANTTGRYSIVLATPSNGPKPPVLQFIPDRTLREGERVSFIVEASDPNGGTPALSAAPLPAGASFVDQGNGVAVFDWTPRIGQAGHYSIAYTASDLRWLRSRSAYRALGLRRGCVDGSKHPD
ncbi:MAG TPA: Ig domain-containing protein, partial [Burkholderiales bacterium]|nr:Ig domain-containing protein [Burkholderiales bacterium]